MKMLLILASLAFLLGACNTVNGVGKDLSAAARGVGNALGMDMDSR